MKTRREVDQEWPRVFPIVMRHKVPNNYLPLFDDQFGEQHMRFDTFRPDLEAAPEYEDSPNMFETSVSVLEITRQFAPLRRVPTSTDQGN